MPGFTVPAGPPLNVEANLTLEIDGQPASITGSGQHLVMRLDSPGHTLRAVRGLAPSSALGDVAVGLQAAGVRLDVEGEHGRLLSLGAGVDSTLGRLGTGSRAVAAGSPRALSYLGGQLVRRAALARRQLLVVVGATAVTAVAARRLLRRAD